MDHSAVDAWLAARAIPLSTGTAADFTPLRTALEGVRVVGMGEATHGTREFFLLKHRLLEFLVTELGFTVLAMEASVSAAEAVNDYVLHGTGDPAIALRDLGFWTWHTTEMLDVLHWLRAHNTTAPPERQVRFAGIDPQHPTPSLRWLKTHLTPPTSHTPPGNTPPSHTPPDDAPNDRDLPASSPPGQQSPGREPSHQKPPGHPLADPSRRGQALLAPLEALSGARLGHPLSPDVEEAAAALEAHLAAIDADPRARAHARTLAQSAALLTRPLHDPHSGDDLATRRDRFLADNVDLLLSDPAAKVAIWAHNGHVMAGAHSDGTVPAMGLHLRRRHGPAYYALGLLFGQGEFRARRTRFGRPGTRRPPVRHRVPFAGAPNAVETRLAAACPTDHVVDLRGGPHPEPVTTWLAGANHLRAYGAAVGRLTYKLAFMQAVLADEYDGLAYVTTSTCSTPLP